MSNIKYRYYQQNAMDAGTQLIKHEKHQNGVIVIPTGGGKSHVIAGTADDIGEPGLILQPSKEILEQNYKKLIDLGRNDVSIFSASLGIKRIDNITLATIGSIHKKPELFKEFKYVSVDECDLVNAKGGMYKSFFEAINRPVLGLTATPWRMHGGHKAQFGGYTGSVNKMLTRTRPKIFHDLIHITQIGELYEHGYLCPLDYKEGYFDQRQLTLNSTGNDYTDASLKRISHAVNEDAIGSIMHTSANSHLVFVKRIEDAEFLVQELAHKGFGASYVTGDMPTTEREKRINGFKYGESSIMINVGVLTVGFDYPALDHIVLARPTNSARLYYQMLGRGIRIHDSKDRCTLTDLCGNVDRLGKIENWEIRDNDGDKQYRLYDNDRPLTGIDMKTGEDLEKKRAKDLRNQNAIHFGKYKGKLMSEVPKDYLEWIVANFSDGVFKNKAKDELARRAVS